MFKRLALAGATATLALGFATTAMASGLDAGQALGGRVATYVLDRVLRHPSHR